MGIGLPDTFDFWNGIRWWFGVIAGIASVVAIVGYWRASDIERREKAAGPQLEAEILNAPPSQWPTSLLAKNGYQLIELPEGNGISILVERPKGKPSDPAVTSVIVKGPKDETLAWAMTIAFGDRYSWPYSNDQVSYLLDGDNHIPLTDAVRATGLNRPGNPGGCLVLVMQR